MLANNAHPCEPQNSKCFMDKIHSEMRDKFQTPILKKPAVTRTKRLEHFLWNEFYEEYIRAKELLNTRNSERQITEYTDEFGTPSFGSDKNENDKEIAAKMMASEFPLYSTAAISFYNPKGNDGIFRKTYSITLPTSLQQGQFG